MQKTEKKKHFLVIGRAGLDLYAEPIGTPLQEAKIFSAQLGGSAGNIATGLSQQGCSCSLLTGISDDGIGKFTKNYLIRYDIATDLISEFPKNKNTLAIVDTNGERTQSTIYRDAPADLQINEDSYNAIDFNSFSHFIITGTSLTKNPSRKLVLKIMKVAKDLGKQVVFDIDYRTGTWQSQAEAISLLHEAAGASTILVGNDVEFDFMAGKPGKGKLLAESIGHSSTNITIYKMGKKGCLLFTHGEKTKFDSYKVNEIKPTGAGDAFLAGFCAAYVSHNNIREAVLNGAATAAIVVTKVGCSDAMPTKKQILEFVNANNTPKIQRI